jgi:hypothetical protein
MSYCYNLILSNNFKVLILNITNFVIKLIKIKTQTQKLLIKITRIQLIKDNLPPIIELMKFY